MKIKIADLPVSREGPGMKMCGMGGFGDHVVSYNEFAKGTDFTPVLKGLPNDSCHCPHMGYIFEGAFRFIYDDGTEEVFRAGEVFYAPAGHTAIVDEDLKFVDFSPGKEHGELMDHVSQVMDAMGG